MFPSFSCSCSLITSRALSSLTHPVVWVNGLTTKNLSCLLYTFFTHESCCMVDGLTIKNLSCLLYTFLPAHKSLHLLYTYLHYKRIVWCCVDVCLSPLRVWVQISFRDTVCVWRRVDFSGCSSFLPYHPLSSFIIPNRWRWKHFSTKPTNSSKWSYSSQILPFSCLFILFILSVFSSFSL